MLRSILIALMASLVAAMAHSDPLTCDRDEDGELEYRISESVCDNLDLDDLPDEAYGWSSHYRIDQDIYVLLVRYENQWEVYASLDNYDGNDEPLVLEQPTEIDPTDAEFWEDYDPGDGERNVSTEVYHEISTPIPNSAGKRARSVVSNQGLEATLAEFDYMAFFEEIDAVCVGGRFLTVYVVQNGAAHYGSSLRSCGAPIPQLPLIEAINTELIKYGVTTPEFLNGLPYSADEN